MENSEFQLDKTNRGSSELLPRAEQRGTLHRYLGQTEADYGSSQGYYNLADWWHLLFRHRMTLGAFALAGLVGAIVISLVQTPIYRVRTSLQIQGPNYPEIKTGESGDASGGYSSPESYMETQVKLLQSESLLEDVVDKLKLHAQKPSGWRVLVTGVRHIFAPKSTPLAERDELLRQIERNLTVRTSGNSRLLEVLYESPDPRVGADFANTLVSEFIQLSQEERWKSAQGTADWLTSHLDQMKGQLESSEKQLQDYAQQSGLAITSEKENPAENRLKELLDELSKAQADRIEKQARFEETQKKSTDSLPEVLQDATVRDYRQKLADLQRQYAELSATLTPEHYKVQRVQAQIDALKSEMQKEHGNVLTGLRNSYAAALRRERLLMEAHANQEKIVEDQSGKAIHYDTLKRDVDSNRRLYEMMLQRVKEASLTAAMRDSNAIVVDRARPPLKPYRPSLPMNSAIGLFGGIFLGFGFVLVRERIDRRISAPGEAQVFLGLPELGVIPADEFSLPSGVLDRLHPRRAAPLPPQRGPKSPLGDCPELATWKRKPSLLAECARTTLTSILLPGNDADTPRIIVLTSPRAADGKTTVACNLSIAMAEIGRKVLLIDGDLRRPRLHKVFGKTNDWGLSDTLVGNSSLESVPLSQLVRETEVSGLYLLPGGQSGATPSNLFYSPRMSRLLQRLRNEFDMVMIDAPPMIHLADARVLGRLSDGVILVVRSGQTTTDSAMFASQRFAEDGTRVLGTVLNSWDPRTTERYGYAGYADYREYAGH